MVIPVLQLGAVSEQEQLRKAQDEFLLELKEATTLENKLEETLDVIQALIGYMTVIATKDEIEMAVQRHFNKLKDRDWDFAGYINCIYHKKEGAVI